MREKSKEWRKKEKTLAINKNVAHQRELGEQAADYEMVVCLAPSRCYREGAPFLHAVTTLLLGQAIGLCYWTGLFSWAQ